MTHHFHLGHTVSHHSALIALGGAWDCGDVGAGTGSIWEYGGSELEFGFEFWGMWMGPPTAGPDMNVFK
jgi:hypothetical protein